MTDITAICDSENLPRVRLLQSHMQNLGINLRLADDVPPDCDRLLLIPRRKNSRLADVAVLPGAMRVVLYLDRDAEVIDGDLTFAIPAWPARSSDADVSELARTLRTLRPPLPEDQTQPKRRFDPNNLIALGLLAGLAVLFVAMSQLGDSSDAPAEPAQAVIEPEAIEPTAAEEKVIREQMAADNAAELVMQEEQMARETSRELLSEISQDHTSSSPGQASTVAPASPGRSPAIAGAGQTTLSSGHSSGRPSSAPATTNATAANSPDDTRWDQRNMVFHRPCQQAGYGEPGSPKGTALLCPPSFDERKHRLR